MEKKNINIWVVRTCTILLLTVFTIGRKYGEEQKAEKLINDLKQQPCACCLNFENVDASALEIDGAKNQLQNDKNQLQNDKNQLQNDKNQLQNDKIFLQNQINILQNEKNQLIEQNANLVKEKENLGVNLVTVKTNFEEDIKVRDNEKFQLQNKNKELENEINNLQKENKGNEGAVQVAEVVNGKLSQYIKDLAKINKSNIVLQNEKQKISEEKTNLEKELNEYKQILQGKILELDNTKKEIEDLKKTKEKIESDLKTKNEEIEKYKKENGQLIEEKKKLENELKELEKKYKKNYESTVEKNDKIVGENTEATNNIKDLLEKWKKENEKLMIDINEKKKTIEELNKKIEDLNKEIENLNKEKNELNKRCEDLNKDCENLEKKLEELNLEKQGLESELETCSGLLIQANKEKNSLAEMLKTTKINVNIEEYVKFYNSFFAEKKTKIDKLLYQDAKYLKEKKYTFYIPFKFKDCEPCLKEKDIINFFDRVAGPYNDAPSLEGIFKSLFDRCGLEKFNKEKIINVKILKEIYLYAKLPYDKNGDLNIDEKKLEEENIVVPDILLYSTQQKKQEKIKRKNVRENKILTSYDEIVKGKAYDKMKKELRLNYSELIELVEIDEYLKKKRGLNDNKNLFLLELDFKDPECIALLEFVGKGNYGVVKKGLTFENGEWVTKAIKFTCHNEKFENSKEGNILKEIRAGKIINEIGVGNKIAFVKDYMKIKDFIKRSYDNNGKIVSLNEENEKGDLKNAVYTTFLNGNLETLPSGKENVRENFENNVFNREGKIDGDLYIMFMDLVSGSDLFLNEEKKNIDINILGKMLFDVLISLYISGVALKDIKPKNIIWNEQKNDFSIIDVQTLGKVGRDLNDSYGTPELWPFFKTLNLNLESKNEINDNEIKNNDEKDNLYDLFCNSIDDNFVDIYAACMTMYFAKFNTYTAAGLLTLLLKWIILEKNKVDDKYINKIISIENKIKFLENYDKNYTNYIKDKNKNEKKGEKLLKKDSNEKLDLNIEKNLIKYFFEEIDDKNLNDDQKKDLANLLKQVISLGNESNIFYLLKGIKKIVNKYESKYHLQDDIKNIITFYKGCVKEDFKNFAKLYNENCNYADVIKYVLCYGSCLNYNGENKEGMSVDDILKQLKLKENIEINDEAFFNGTDNAIKNVIANLRSGFNQKFIIDLLTILPLEKYNEILEHDVNKDSVNYYFKSKIDSLKENEEYKKDKIEEIKKQKKVFYLLRYLEINKLFHIPKNILKINSLINKNTNNKLVGK